MNADARGAGARPTLLLIEDDPGLGPLIEEVLSEVYDVTRHVDGREGLVAGLDGDFDVLVVDRRLPSIEGLGIVERLRRGRVTSPILMLTALGTVADRVDGLDAGADDYLVKPFEFDELLARLRALTRTFSASGSTLPIGSWRFAPEEHVLTSPYGDHVVLTERESGVLAVLAREPERTFSREHLLRVAFPAGEKPGTVDTYVHYLRRKTEKEIVLTMRGRGYRLGSL
ncbi:response regulator transcription factor [Frondihabitans australicus]|uniref:Two-component system response regulator QseB n=1 Tax=Frondihabitans australicus TaxID=386892 RepID=A0A495ICQ3_9MICO|nr:response regulator transcription factor [Frondihabitans australicus]RKR73722.1 two-component system response regulator QseB [Frondihabitans australicus]